MSNRQLPTDECWTRPGPTKRSAPPPTRRASCTHDQPPSSQKTQHPAPKPLAINAPRTATAQVVESIPPLDGEAAAAAVNPYETLEDELRDQLMEGLLDIPGEGEFEDALLIELRRVRVDVRSVRVKILTWAGRRQDLPDQVSFNLKVMARDGELDRDLGALGLVMGKYIQHYGLQAVELNVILSSEDGLRKVVMDPEVARRYFTHRVSLERFLQSAFSGA